MHNPSIKHAATRTEIFRFSCTCSFTWLPWMENEFPQSQSRIGIKRILCCKNRLTSIL